MSGTRFPDIRTGAKKKGEKEERKRKKKSFEANQK